MRITRHGTRKFDPEIEATCTGCHCQIAFRLTEAIRVSDPRDGDYYEIQCPECPRHITVAAHIAERTLPDSAGAERG